MRFLRMATVLGLVVSLSILGAGIARAVDKAAPPVLKLESTPPGAQISLRGCVHFDFLGYDTDEKMLSTDTGSQENDFIVRRARLYFQGKLWDQVGFFVQAGLEIPEYPFLDAYITMPVVEGVTFRAGQMKANFSQERLRSYLHQPLMERSPVALLENRRSQGIVLAAAPKSNGLIGELGLFTGEAMHQHNTDDHFEYVGRITLKPEKLIDGFPGSGQLAGSVAYGRRSPERVPVVTSFTGRTMNNLVWFKGIPVNGYRTRFEADAEWRYETIWIAGEWIQSTEQRENVTVDVDTDSDGAKDGTFKDSLDPLQEWGYYAYIVWVITGEPAAEYIVPANDFGAVSLVVRYGEVTFDAGDLPDRAGGVEVNAVSTTLGRESVSERMRELYVGFDWDVKPEVFIQFAALWRQWDDSSPYGLEDRDTSDINYRARVGVMF